MPEHNSTLLPILIVDIGATASRTCVRRSRITAPGCPAPITTRIGANHVVLVVSHRNQTRFSIQSIKSPTRDIHQYAGRVPLSHQRFSRTYSTDNALRHSNVVTRRFPNQILSHIPYIQMSYIHLNVLFDGPCHRHVAFLRFSNGTLLRNRSIPIHFHIHFCYVRLCDT